MARRKGVLKSAGLVSAMVGVLVCVVVGQRLIASSAFNALESATWPVTRIGSRSR